MIPVFRVKIGYNTDSIVEGCRFTIEPMQADRVADHYVWVDGKRNHRLGKGMSFFDTHHEAILFVKARSEYYVDKYNRAIQSILNTVNSYE